MAHGKRLVIGLGNPGAEYEHTRHNVGFVVAEAVAERAQIDLTYDGRAKALLGWGRLRGYDVGVAKPLAYMNRSGTPVKHLIQRFSIPLDEMLVIYDDINLPPGTLRLRPKGSAGGHNGLQDIIDRLGTDAFPRLRVGIGSEFSRGRQVEYVLAPFSEEQQPIMDEAVEQACEAAITFVCEGMQPAMNRFN